MNPLLVIIITMTIALGAACVWLWVVEARADRAHRQWMRRNEQRRRRTQTAVQGIRYGQAGVGLDGRANHTGALRKHTRP